MSRRALVLVLVLVSSLSLAAAGPAAAQASIRSFFPAETLETAVGTPVVPEARFRTGFGLDPTGPYRVWVGTAGDAVVVSVSRGDRRERLTFSKYLARGVAAPEHLKATFGKLGKISMRFRESRDRPWHGKKRRCRGAGRFVVRRGVFVGSFRFRGEGGYISIRAHRAKGAISSVASKCQRHDRRRSARSSSSIFEETLTGFIASDREGVDSTVFGAISFRGELGYIAQREESRGQLGILRTAIVNDRGELPLNEAVTAGKFSPGRPFRGDGLYRAAPDGSTSWSGSLTVDFPGAPRHPLTGPDYEMFLEAGL